jgi:hypothetical protein
MGTREKAAMVVTALAAAVSVVYLQHRFDAADVKNCVAIAQTYKAPSGRTIPGVLEKRHPGAAVEWRGTEESSCFQHVRVDAVVTPKGEPAVDYAFSVDLNGPSIHPANPLGQQALEALDEAAGH